MAEKQAKKNEIQEFKNFSEVLDLASEKKTFPKIFFYVSEDSFEFDLITDLYRNFYQKQNSPFEVIVYVAEGGDFEKLFSEIFNLSMFSENKLLIIRSGTDFFKPFLTASKKEEFETFKKSIPNIPDGISILIHYDSKEIPAKLSQLFIQKYSVLKNRNLYSDERLPSLESILKSEKVNMDLEAKEEFLHRIQPNTGAYTKSIRKLKNILFKKDFELKDVEDVLFNQADFNPFYAVDYLFKVQKQEFFKEISKLKLGNSGQPEILSFLNACLTRVNEIRKASILFQRFQGLASDQEFFSLMGFGTYSEPRKRFVKSRLQKESRIFSKLIQKKLFFLLKTINLKIKTTTLIDKFFLGSEFEKIFFALSETSR